MCEAGEEATSLLKILAPSIWPILIEEWSPFDYRPAWGRSEMKGSNARDLAGTRPDGPRSRGERSGENCSMDEADASANHFRSASARSICQVPARAARGGPTDGNRYVRGPSREAYCEVHEYWPRRDSEQFRTNPKTFQTFWRRVSSAICGT